MERLKERLDATSNILYLNRTIDLRTRETTRLNIFRLKSYIRVLDNPHGTDLSQLEAGLMTGLSTDMRELLSKCAVVANTPAGLCVLLHKMQLGDDSQTSKHAALSPLCRRFVAALSPGP